MPAPAKKHRIEDVVQAAGVARSTAAMALRGGRPNTVGLLVAEITNLFHAALEWASIAAFLASTDDRPDASVRCWSVSASSGPMA